MTCSESDFNQITLATGKGARMEAGRSVSKSTIVIQGREGGGLDQGALMGGWGWWTDPGCMLMVEPIGSLADRMRECVCECVCVCVRERERERERAKDYCLSHFGLP